MQGLGGHLRRSFVAPLFIIAQKHDTTDGLAIHRRIEMPGLLLLSGRRPSPFLEVDTSPSQSLNTVASLSLGQFLSRRLLLSSSPQDLQNGRALKLEGLHCITWFKNALSATGQSRGSQGAEMGISLLIKTSERSPSGPSPRHWTNVLLASNVLVYVAQLATRGRLMQWGAQISTKIYQGQWWRLVTSSFLHVNIWHLLANCYALDYIGPFVESFSGPKRFIAIYFTSAVASSAMSYWFSKASSVGASGAIAGLVGAAAVFAMQHRGEYEGATKVLENIAIVIALNMLIGLAWKRIDNWGHLGGLLGGSAVTWLLSFAWN